MHQDDFSHAAYEIQTAFCPFMLFIMPAILLKDVAFVAFCTATQSKIRENRPVRTEGHSFLVAAQCLNSLTKFVNDVKIEGCLVCGRLFDTHNFLTFVIVFFPPFHFVSTETYQPKSSNVLFV